MAPVRHADWRFLLPSPVRGVFGHLVLLGGTPELAATLIELGVARQVTRALHPGDRADALIVLAGAEVAIETALDSLDDDGVLYWEIDRRAPGQLTLTPGRATALLRRAGLTTERCYWVKPGFPRRHMYVPLDAGGAVRWYLDTLYRAHSVPRRMFRTALHTLAGYGAAESAAPCVAVTAVRGAARRPALLDRAAARGIPLAPGAAPVLIAQGDYEWNRVAMLLFDRQAAAPSLVLKLPRRPLFNREIEWEHACITDIRDALPGDAARAVPASALFGWNDLAVSVQSCVPGPNLHSRAAATADTAALDDVRAGAAWLSRLHAATATGRVVARDWLGDRIRRYARDYAATYGETPEERGLVEAALARLDRLPAATLPIVWQHGDFGPWNIYRGTDGVAVIDWETARRGPALADLLYFVTHWHFESTGCESDAEQCRRLEALYCTPAADARVRALREIVHGRMRDAGVTVALLPVLLVYTLLEQAVDRMRRLALIDGAERSARSANAYVAYLGVLAAHAERLFREPASAGEARADVTVAVATRHRPAQLVRCVDAVLAGRMLPAEVVVIDQSDDDETARACAAAAWPRVPVRVVRDTGRGLAASRNTAVAHATTPIVAFTDDDCVPDAGWLQAIAAAFDAPGDAAAVTGRILPLGPERPGLYAVSSRESGTPAIYTGRALPWVVGSGGNTAVRRDWIARVGGFDERLGAGAPGRAAEDTDLLYRLLRAGATVRYEPDALVLHERKDSRGHLATRPAYGFGMGAFCALRACRRDPYAIWMLGRWCADRGRRLAGGFARRRWRRVREELLMLAGAWRGVMYGMRTGWER